MKLHRRILKKYSHKICFPTGKNQTITQKSYNSCTTEVPRTITCNWEGHIQPMISPFLFKNVRWLAWVTAHYFFENLLINIQKPFIFLFWSCSAIIKCLYPRNVSIYVPMLMISLFFLHDVTGKVTVVNINVNVK